MCVSGFDHHCEWVNNCIGEKNYKAFITLIASLEVYELFYIFLKVSLLQKDIDTPLLICIGVNLAVNAVVVVSNGFLMAFHVYLKVKGISTYDYIVNLRRPKQIISMQLVTTETNKYLPD